MTRHFCGFVSRTDDVIVTGGYKVSPAEVQRVLRRHQAIRDVAVVGVGDTTRGRFVRACVIRKPDIETHGAFAREIKDYAKTQVAAFKCPRQVAIFKELPGTSTGKRDRAILKGAAAGDAWEEA